MNRSVLISSRIGKMLIAIFVIVLVFIGRLFWIQVVDGPRLSKEASDRQSIAKTLYGVRGTIFDRNGIALAESVDRYDITASPRFVADFTRDGVDVSVTQALTEIANLTGADQGEMHTAITKDPESDFAYLVKGVTIDVLRKVKALGIPWVYNDLRPSRTYPRGSVAGNLVGFMGTDGPLTGAEYYLNDCLKATNGSSTYERGADGILIPGSTVVQKDAVNGGSVDLTIDSDLQWFAQQTLATESDKLGAKWATAMVVDVNTGEILVAADYPSVDPNNVFASAKDDRGARIFSTPYEPGSIIKPLIIAHMLDNNQATVSTKVTVPKRLKFKGGKIKDAFEHGTLKMTTTGVLVNSSNIGINILATDLTKQERHDYLTSWGFNEKTNVHFLGESSGRVPAVSETDDVTKLTEIFGQGIATTSVQVAQAYQALGNLGVKVPLTLVKGCTRDGVTTPLNAATSTTRVISESAARDTLTMMENVAHKGSVKRFMKGLGYRIALKTGTAEVAKNGSYGADRIISIAGVAPAEDPQFAIIVTIGIPKYGKAAVYAAPAFAAISGQVLKQYRVQPSDTKYTDLPTDW
ncbi:MAG: hypothetical protein RLZ72_824 [Actinomycetota bacterium]